MTRCPPAKANCHKMGVRPSLLVLMAEAGVCMGSRVGGTPIPPPMDGRRLRIPPTRTGVTLRKPTGDTTQRPKRVRTGPPGPTDAARSAAPTGAPTPRRNRRTPEKGFIDCRRARGRPSANPCSVACSDCCKLRACGPHGRRSAALELNRRRASGRRGQGRHHAANRLSYRRLGDKRPGGRNAHAALRTGAGAPERRAQGRARNA